MHTVLLYTIQSSVKILLFTENSVPFRVQWLLHSVQDTVYSIQYTVYSIQLTLYSVQYTVYTIHYTLYTIQCTDCVLPNWPQLGADLDWNCIVYCSHLHCTGHWTCEVVVHCNRFANIWQPRKSSKPSNKLIMTEWVIYQHRSIGTFLLLLLKLLYIGGWHFKSNLGLRLYI